MFQFFDFESIKFFNSLLEKPKAPDSEMEGKCFAFATLISKLAASSAKRAA